MSTANVKIVRARRRASPAGIRLTTAGAAIAKGMLARGDRSSDVASFFCVNSGRIAEISTGKNFAAVEPAPESHLPPPGPYIVGLSVAQVRAAIESARRALDEVASQLPKSAP